MPLLMDCDRIRRLLVTFDVDSQYVLRRFDVLVMAAMVRLIADGANRRSGVAEIILLPALALRILAEDGRVIVLQLYGTTLIT